MLLPAGWQLLVRLENGLCESMLDIDVLKFDHSIGAHRELGSPLISQKLFVLAFTTGLEGLSGDTKRHERLWTSHLAIERV